MSASDPNSKSFCLYVVEHRTVVLLYLLLTAGVLYRTQIYPSLVPNADALGYVEQAFAFRKKGLMSDFGTLRTYGYPFIIYLYSFITGLNPPAVALIGGGLQLAAYGISVLWLGMSISLSSPTLARACVIALLLNPLIVVLVGDILTESVSLILVVLTLVSLVRLAQPSTTLENLGWAAFGAMTATFSVMVRPINLLVVVAWALGALVYWWFTPRSRVRRAVDLLGFVLIFIAAAIAMWAPQYLYNSRLGSPGIFPLHSLFDTQVRWGIVLLKYATIVIDQHAEGLFFPNPWCVLPIPSSDSGTWYLAHPIRGAATILGHLFGAFSVETPFVYTYDVNPPYFVPLVTATWLVITVGVLHGSWLILNLIRRAMMINLVSGPALAFVLSLSAAVVASNGLLAVETRFNIVPIAILSVLAVHFASFTGGETPIAIRSIRVWIVACAFAMTVGATIISYAMAKSAVRMSGDLVGHPCLAAQRPPVDVDKR
jgi:hypothetical protein